MKLFPIIIASVLLCAATTAEAKQNLETRRAVEAAKKKIPAKVKKFKSICGYDVKIDVKWSTFTSKASVQGIEHGLFDRFFSDLEDVCKDDLGKKALKDAMAKVVISEGSKTVVLKSKALTIKGKFAGSVGTDYPGHSDYKKEILKKL